MLITQLIAVFLATLIPATQKPADGLALTVMSFNIRYGTANDGDNSWPHRRELVMRVIKDRDADILGVQEALTFQLDEITASVPAYAVIGVGRDDGRAKGEYTAILYRADRFHVDSSGTFWLSDTPETVASTSWGNSITRICTWARLIDRESGNAFYIFNTHLDHRSQPSREKSARLLAQRIGQRAHNDPFVLMGDFNAGESNPAVTSLTAHAGGEDDAQSPGYIQTYRAIHPDEKNSGTFGAFTGQTSGEMIDHILVPPSVTVLDADIDRTNEDGRYPSDHFPIWAKLTLPGADHCPQTRARLDNWIIGSLSPTQPGHPGPWSSLVCHPRPRRRQDRP